VRVVARANKAARAILAPCAGQISPRGRVCVRVFVCVCTLRNAGMSVGLEKTQTRAAGGGLRHLHERGLHSHAPLGERGVRVCETNQTQQPRGVGGFAGRGACEGRAGSARRVSRCRGVGRAGREGGESAAVQHLARGARTSRPATLSVSHARAHRQHTDDGAAAGACVAEFAPLSPRT
jgi:hypothetical protein